MPACCMQAMIRLLASIAPSSPPGPSRYPVLPVSTIDAEPAVPAVSPEVDAPTGVQSSAPAGEEYSVNVVHWAANADPLPGHEANTANARSPTVSRSVTRSPSVFTWVQVWPRSWVANSCGPNAHPSMPLRNLIPPPPVAPLGAPASGAGTPNQVFPALSVRATEVQ